MGNILTRVISGDRRRKRKRADETFEKSSDDSSNDDGDSASESGSPPARKSRTVDIQTPKRKHIKSTSKYIYETLFVKGDNSDVTIQALGRDWHLHKHYLKQSGYFCGMLSGSWKESNQDVIQLDIPDNNVDEKALQTALGCLYKDDVVLKPVDVIGVLAAATLLQMDGLIKHCTEFMKETISSSTAVTYQAASQMYSLPDVATFCQGWMLHNVMAPSNLAILKDISEDLMPTLVGSGELWVLQVEMDLYTLLKKWIFLRHNPTWSGRRCQLMSNVDSFFKQLTGDECYLESTFEAGGLQLRRRLDRWPGSSPVHQRLCVYATSYIGLSPHEASSAFATFATSGDFEPLPPPASVPILSTLSAPVPRLASPTVTKVDEEMKRVTGSSSVSSYKVQDTRRDFTLRLLRQLGWLVNLDKSGLVDSHSGVHRRPFPGGQEPGSDSLDRWDKIQSLIPACTLPTSVPQRVAVTSGIVGVGAGSYQQRASSTVLCSGFFNHTLNPGRRSSAVLPSTSVTSLSSLVDSPIERLRRSLFDRAASGLPTVRGRLLQGWKLTYTTRQPPACGAKHRRKHAPEVLVENVKPPQDVEEPVFLARAMRCGRVLPSNEEFCWRWVGYSYGIDALITYKSRLISLMRNNSSSLNYPGSVSLQPHRSMYIRLTASNINEHGCVTATKSTGIKKISLDKNESVVLLSLENSFKFPLYITVCSLMTTPNPALSVPRLDVKLYSSTTCQTHRLNTGEQDKPDTIASSCIGDVDQSHDHVSDSCQADPNSHDESQHSHSLSPQAESLLAYLRRSKSSTSTQPHDMDR
ncbi:uncharacterized protein LOC124261482 [Haliotis rubra]|uniref:uncharacterized protein LOC124261482 n=1 Tax=Haliotis rubra TaxID=36100 RepID=UPI001EE4FD88|nr:uncharacterized protein LOC124261482 [Haliotis rubra]